MAKGGYVYMVDTRGPKADLVRAGNGTYERYDPRVPGEWEGSEFLDAFAWGGSDFVWYDDVPEEDVEFYKDKIRKFWAEKEKEESKKED